MKRILFLILWSCAITNGASATEASASLRFHAELRQALEKAVPSPNPVDPNEPANREMFRFNLWLAQNIMNPLTQWLGYTLPDIIKQAGYNFYDNLVEPQFIITNSLIGNYEAAQISAKRFLLNSTIGLGGLWDPAESMGYQRTETEFTESLCVAGLDPGNFLILPIIGPTTSKTATVLTSFFFLEWYFFSSYISPIITGAIDLSVSAASLRYALDLPDSSTKDPYLTQRADYQNYLWTNCSSFLNKKLLPTPNRELALDER